MNRKVVAGVMVAGLAAAALGAGVLANRPDSSDLALTADGGQEVFAPAPGSVKGLPSGGGALDSVASRTGGGSVAAAPASKPPATGAAYDASGGGGAGDTLPQAASLDRKLVFSGNISLRVGDVPKAFNDASRVARENGGFVEQSMFAATNGSDDGSRSSASLTIRVPADRYQDALASLRGIEGAKVLGEGSKATEVTEQYTDLQSRLRNLERTESQYLVLLGKATTIADILSVNDRLDGVRGQIEQVQGRIKLLDNITEFAAIDVSLSPLATGKSGGGGDGPRGFVQAFADAWEGSLEAARYAASGAGVIAVIAIWVVIPLAVLYIAARTLRRRHGSALSS